MRRVRLRRLRRHLQRGRDQAQHLTGLAAWQVLKDAARRTGRGMLSGYARTARHALRPRRADPARWHRRLADWRPATCERRDGEP